jgi:uncharacterized protein YeaO (DUF488 family)
MTGDSTHRLVARHVHFDRSDEGSKLKRAYDAMLRTDGTRFLVERLWPRGVSKATLQLDAWLKDVGPSTALRKWFSHDPA